MQEFLWFFVCSSSSLISSMFHSASPGPLLGHIKAERSPFAELGILVIQENAWSREEERKAAAPEFGLFIAPKSGLEKPGGTAGKEALPFSIAQHRVRSSWISDHPFA